MEELINEEFKILKENSKSKYLGINTKSSKEVVILKISENYFNKKNYEIFSKKNHRR